MSKAARLTPMHVLGRASGAGVALVGLHDFATAVKERSHLGCLDAVSTVAWGASAVLAFHGFEHLGKWGASVSQFGALCQIGAGCTRIVKGLRERDRSLMILGALDGVGGAAWLAWETVGFPNPYFLAGYAALMFAREAYDHREELQAWGKRAAAKGVCFFDQCKARLAAYGAAIRIH